MGQHLLLTVHLHDRFHGMAEGNPEWPPAPGRVFQALVAGAGRGRSLPEPKRLALQWLESLPAPLIASPPAELGHRVSLFVPNNDADSLSHPRDVGSIRTQKVVHPRILQHGQILYAWPLVDGAGSHADQIVEAANDVYQLGRGIDMAWATGEVLSEDALTERLAAFDGQVQVPSADGEGILACPSPGTLRSLLSRHTAQRLTVEDAGHKPRTYFTNAPKPFFVGVAYVPRVLRLLFDLRRADAPDRPAPARASDVVALVERIRDAAVARLQEAMPTEEIAIQRCLVGRRPDGTGDGPPGQRVRIVPLPSIGHEHADRSIRRVLIEIPSGTPLRPDDVAWAFSGMEVSIQATSEMRIALSPAEDRMMLDRHYLPQASRWRSVTPIALPESAARRRIDPARRREDAKGGPERTQEELAAMSAIRSALRHAAVPARATAIRVQREPLGRKGLRAEAFERKPRFPKERLWHAEIDLDRSVEGPMVLGDGRFLGLGVMAPELEYAPGMYAFIVKAGAAVDPIGLARALRRAVMSRVGVLLGSTRLGRFFSSHEPDRGPAREGSHLAFHFDPIGSRLLVIAPHILEQREPDRRGGEIRDLKALHQALEEFTELRAGQAGAFTLRRTELLDTDPLIRPARVWTSATAYVVTRHAKHGQAESALVQDLVHECARRGLPIPEVEVLACRAVRRLGLSGNLRLVFPKPQLGPMALGRTRYLGGGLFVAAPE